MRKIFLTLFIIFFLNIVAVYSQCAMCRRVAETSHDNDEGKSRGLNKGILYLLSIPYILGGIGVFVYYKSKKKI
jgi:Mn2+/Fe2+ NRAMP family transporter